METGLNLVGFFRSMQGEYSGVSIALVVILVLFVIAHLFLNSDEDCERDGTRRMVNWIAIIAVVLTVGGFFMTATLSFTANRLPRQDVDRSEVFKQMNSHLKPEK